MKRASLCLINLRVGWLAVAIVSLAGAAGFAFLAKPGLPEAFYCERPMVDLGKLAQDDTAESEFELINGFRELKAAWKFSKGRGLCDF